MEEISRVPANRFWIGRCSRAAWSGVCALWERLTAAVAFLYKDPQPWLLELGVAGFLAGFFILPNNILHGLWFLFTIVIPIWRWRQKDLDLKVLDDAGFWLLTLLLVWMLGSSLVIAAPNVIFSEALVSLADSAGILCLYAAIAVLLRSKFQERRRLLTPFPIVGAVATAISLVWFYSVNGNPFPSERLRNVFVHFDSGGLHPVVTGLICGCAAMTAACLYTRQANWKRQSILLFSVAILSAGVFYSQSRGSMLALAVAFATYVITRKDRSWVLPGIMVTLVGLTYFFQPGGEPQGLIDRGDAGRLDLYAFLFAQMEGLPAILFGKGLWVVDSATVEQVGWHAHHPHSAILTTFFHGGIVGLILTASLVGLGALRAIGVYRATGDGTWLVLLAFGVAGQLVDGSMPFSLVTLPRIEPILLLFPIAAASSAYCEYVRAQEQTASEAAEGHLF
jgi:hypothetical protein